MKHEVWSAEAPAFWISFKVCSYAYADPYNLIGPRYGHLVSCFGLLLPYVPIAIRPVKTYNERLVTMSPTTSQFGYPLHDGIYRAPLLPPKHLGNKVHPIVEAPNKYFQDGVRPTP
jgi:hypothetical protein